MPTRSHFTHFFIFSFLLTFSCLYQVGIVHAADGSAATEDEMEVLTRGPVHEAFADVAVDEDIPGVVTARSVPEPINEIPPDYRPEGENVQWISGYWNWDEDQNDFIWVSGIWREVPPGREWIPGYWLAVEGGSQYISGYWAEVQQPETVYLPPPPKPLQVQPAFPAPSVDDVWIDGSWVWYNERYAWQPGYWHAATPDMIWVPAHYTWTPRGYIFVRGYWDYLIVRRGVMFAPCYYARPIYRRPGFFYTPSIILDTDAVFFSLFIRTNHRHYYFGDYFDNRYERRGYLPWYSEHATIFGYDPFYRNYRRHQLRRDKQWEHDYRSRYEYRREHVDARPAVIYTPRVNIHAAQPHRPQAQIIGRHLADVAERKDQPVRYIPVTPDHKREFKDREQQRSTLQVERRKTEMRPAHQEGPNGPTSTRSPQSHMPPQREKSYKQPGLPSEMQQPSPEAKHYPQPAPQPRQPQVQHPKEQKQRAIEQPKEMKQPVQQTKHYAQPAPQPRQQQVQHPKEQKQRAVEQPKEMKQPVQQPKHYAQPAPQPRQQQVQHSKEQKQRSAEQPKEMKQPVQQPKHYAQPAPQPRQQQVQHPKEQKQRAAEQPKEMKQPVQQTKHYAQPVPPQQRPQVQQEKEQRNKQADQPSGNSQAKRPKNGEQIPVEQMPSGAQHSARQK